LATPTWCSSALSVRDVSVRQELTWALGGIPESGAEAHRLSTALRYAITGDRNPSADNGSSAQGGAGLPGSSSPPNSPPVSARGCRTRFRSARAPQSRRGCGGIALAPRERTCFAAGVGAPRRREHQPARGRGISTQSPGYEKLAQSDYVLDLTNPAAGLLQRALGASVGGH
jgi:hypothetical protein